MSHGYGPYAGFSGRLRKDDARDVPYASEFCFVDKKLFAAWCDDEVDVDGE